MSRFVKAIQMRYRCASIIWLHDGVWLDVVVSSADIAIAEQVAVEEVLPNSTHRERLFALAVLLLITPMWLSCFPTFPRNPIFSLLTLFLYHCRVRFLIRA